MKKQVRFYPLVSTPKDDARFEKLFPTFRSTPPEHAFDDSGTYLEVAVRELDQNKQAIEDLEMLLIGSSEEVRQALGRLLNVLLANIYERFYRGSSNPEIWLYTPELLSINHYPFTYISLSSGHIGTEEDVKRGWDVVL